MKAGYRATLTAIGNYAQPSTPGHVIPPALLKDFADAISAAATATH